VANCSYICNRQGMGLGFYRVVSSSLKQEEPGWEQWESVSLAKAFQDGRSTIPHLLAKDWDSSRTRKTGVVVGFIGDFVPQTQTPFQMS
jgi:hypothetical protein